MINKEKVFGSDTYPSVNTICASALHNGAIGETGGTFKVNISDPIKTYKGDLRNGILSKNYNKAADFSFKIQ